ncbi:hypothetical protein FPV67DRAFT_1674190 [Lyophyllum atratum]|nr:hypothetical protein FPV67DRAFT_1674190 [Lyophyllum atratum]
MSSMPHPRIARWETQDPSDTQRLSAILTGGRAYSSNTHFWGQIVPVPYDYGLGGGRGLDDLVTQYWVPTWVPSTVVYDLGVRRKTFADGWHPATSSLFGNRDVDARFTVYYEDQERDIPGPARWPTWKGNVLVMKQDLTGRVINVDRRDMPSVAELVGLLFQPQTAIGQLPPPPLHSDLDLLSGLGTGTEATPAKYCLQTLEMYLDGGALVYLQVDIYSDSVEAACVTAIHRGADGLTVDMHGGIGTTLSVTDFSRCNPTVAPSPTSFFVTLTRLPTITLAIKRRTAFHPITRTRPPPKSQAGNLNLTIRAQCTDTNAADLRLQTLELFIERPEGIVYLQADIHGDSFDASYESIIHRGPDAMVIDTYGGIGTTIEIDKCTAKPMPSTSTAFRHVKDCNNIIFMATPAKKDW